MIGRRILSFWIDAALAVFLSAAGLFLLRREILTVLDPRDLFNPAGAWARSSFHPLAFLCGLFLYFLLFLAVFSETPGLLLAGLTVVRMDDESGGRKKAGFGRALSRTLLFFFTLATLGTGFLTVFANGRRLALHDCLSGTRVVRERAFVAPPPAEVS